MARYYQLKEQTTGKFWSGTGTIFKQSGKKFNCSMELGTHLKGSYYATELKHLLHSGNYVVEEYAITTSLVSTLDPFMMIADSLTREQILNTYGRTFLKEYVRKRNKNEVETYSHAVILPHNEHSFKARMKELGVNERAYHRTKNIIWLKCQDQAFTANLIATDDVKVLRLESLVATQFSNLQALKESNPQLNTIQ